jgi:hypothetical protein
MREMGAAWPVIGEHGGDWLDEKGRCGARIFRLSADIERVIRAAETWPPGLKAALILDL